MAEKMVTFTFKEPKICLWCPLCHTTVEDRAFCARYSNPLTLVEIDSPRGPRPKECPLKEARV